MNFQSLDRISRLFNPTFTRFLFVRHPFERLASAYKERIALLPKDRIQSEPYYDRMRKMICTRSLNHSQHDTVSSKMKQCENIIPSFVEFVQYVLINAELPNGVARADGHWKPFSVICQVCKFQYNFIGRQETFSDDFGLLLKKFNVSDWTIEKRRGSSGLNRSNYQQLYSSLSDELICRLKILYKDDLNLFSYRVEDYVNRTRIYCWDDYFKFS